jgi:hypothetical protein
MAADPFLTGLAEITVAVTYQGRVHRRDLQVTDSVSPAFVHSLLSEAVENVRDSLREATFQQPLPTEPTAQQVSDDAVAQLKRVADKLGQAEQAEQQLSDLPARGGQCGALVLDGRGRRKPCGYQLDGVGAPCPMAKHHLGATEDKPDPDELF